MNPHCTSAGITRASAGVKIENGLYNASEIIDICKYVKISPTQILIELEYLQQTDVNRNSTAQISSYFTADSFELMSELLRRIDLLRDGIQENIKARESNG